MTLIRLKATNFRNITALDIEFSPHFNLLYGSNGSGKTSILEIIYFLSLGRSFRSHLSSRVINYDQSAFSLFGLIQQQGHLTLPIGIEKNRHGKMRLKIGSETTTSLADLAKILPLQLINPDSYYLLNAGPKQRRQFLDWGVFHLEPSFYPIWQRFQRALKQRNSALQQQTDLKQLKAWDNEFCTIAEELADLRRKYINQLTPVIAQILAELIQITGLTIDYYAGWDNHFSLINILGSGIKRDLALGYTQFGPQRADLNLKLNNIPVEDILSRGEQKLLVCALQLAQGLLLKQTIGKSCIYLLDDLPAELDLNHQQKIAHVLEGLEAQVFITALDIKALNQIKELVTTKMFHVKHGRLNSVM